MFNPLSMQLTRHHPAHSLHVRIYNFRSGDQDSGFEGRVSALFESEGIDGRRGSGSVWTSEGGEEGNGPFEGRGAGERGALDE